LAKVYLKETSTINEIKVKIDTIFSSKTCEDFTDEFETLKTVSKEMPYFKKFDEFKIYMKEKSGLKDEQFSNPLRVLLTGEKSGPELSEIYPHIKNYLGEIIR
jgi:glutamyl-tRNA synthetase